MGQCEQPMVDLLHSKVCPFEYQCLSADCMECAKLHMEKGETDGKE